MSRALLHQLSGPSLLQFLAGWKRTASGEVPPHQFLKRNIGRAVHIEEASKALDLNKRQLKAIREAIREARGKLYSSYSNRSPHLLSCEYKPSEFSGRKMSWLSRGTSNDDLIDQMQAFRTIKSKRVADVMRAVDRGLFVPPSEEPYRDSPQPIGHNATISAPHMHAHCLDLMEDHLKPGAKALDVGSGTGYLTACMGLMIENEGGKAIGVEHIRELTESSKENVRKSAAGKLLEKGVIELHTGDGRKGWSGEAPYDVIHVGAAAPDTPTELLNQLKPGGRLVCPVGDFLEQYLMMYDKGEDGAIQEHASSGVRYVPLTNEEDQRKPRGFF